MGGELVLKPNPVAPLPGNALIIPSVTLFDGTENLRVLSASSVSCVLSIYLRMRRSDGTIDPMTFTHTPNTDRSIRTQDYAIGAGSMLSFVIVPTTGSPRVGETFVQASIIRGLTGATLPMSTLVQDYTTARQPVAWPGSPLRRSTDGDGVLRSIVSHTQTGATNVTTVPTGALWKPDAITLTLNTIPCSGPARTVLFSFQDTTLGTAKWRTWSPVAQAVGTFWAYFISPTLENLDMAVAHAAVRIGAPPFPYLLAGDTMLMDIDSYDGLETLNVYMAVREWLEVA